MSVNINTVTFSGNLTKDPEARTAGAASVVSFTLANTRRFKSGTETKEETAFLDVEAWGKTGELVAQYLTKGQPALVEGRLKQEQWQDKDGNKRSRIKIVAERVHFLGQRQGGQHGDRAQAQADATGMEVIGSDGLRRNPKPQGGASAGSDDPPFARSEMEVMP